MSWFIDQPVPLCCLQRRTVFAKGALLGNLLALAGEEVTSLHLYLLPAFGRGPEDPFGQAMIAEDLMPGAFPRNVRHLGPDVFKGCLHVRRTADFPAAYFGSSGSKEHHVAGHMSHNARAVVAIKGGKQAHE